MEKHTSHFSLGSVFAAVTLQLFQTLCVFTSRFNPGRQLIFGGLRERMGRVKIPVLTTVTAPQPKAAQFIKTVMQWRDEERGRGKGKKKIKNAAVFFLAGLLPVLLPLLGRPVGAGITRWKRSRDARSERLQKAAGSALCRRRGSLRSIPGGRGWTDLAMRCRARRKAGTPYGSLTARKGGLQERWGQTFYRVYCSRTMGNGCKSYRS